MDDRKGSPGDDPAVAAATREAGRLARKWGVDPGDLLGAAWEGAARAARAGKTGRPLLAVAAARGVVSYLRGDAARGGWGDRRSRNGTRSRFVFQVPTGAATGAGSEDGYGTGFGFLEPAAPAPDDRDERREEARRLVDRVLGRLTPAERAAVDARFGLSSGLPLDHREVGRVLGGCASLSHTIVSAALEKCRLELEDAR